LERRHQKQYQFAHDLIRYKQKEKFSDVQM